MNVVADLRAAIARTLAVEVKAYDLAKVCIGVGLSDGTDEEAFRSKTKYVEHRLEEKSLADLLAIGDAVLVAYEGYKLHAFALKEALRFARCNGRLSITEITRRNIFDELTLMGSLWGKLEIDVFLARLWPVSEMASHDPRHKTFSAEIRRHMVMNDDWSPSYLLGRLNVLGLSDEALCELLEQVVHPSAREADEQKAWVDAINKHLQRDRFALTPTDTMSGYPVYRARPLDVGIETAPRNLIFASNGPKPEVVLSDAIHNDIRVVRNGEFCLFYDVPVPDSGLTWKALVDWWINSPSRADKVEPAERTLYKRLFNSLASLPERVLFRAYYKSFKTIGGRLPALIPQVYVHYDPRTLRELYGERRLARQRMDFLLLLDHGRRVVIEVDGAQHYSSDGKPSPSLYAEMAAADRQLRLCGYEVFRFGGAELPDSDAGEATARAFFAALFKKHQIG